MKPLFTALLMLLPLSAQAQVPAVVNSATVEACFSSTPAGQFSPACIGAASNQCQQATPDGSTTIGIASCIQAESEVWDTILNRKYKEVRAAFSTEQGLAEQLLAAQRAWIAFRDAECQLVYAMWIDGTIRITIASECVLQMTARRALELRDMQ